MCLQAIDRDADRRTTTNYFFNFSRQPKRLVQRLDPCHGGKLWSNVHSRFVVFLCCSCFDEVDFDDVRWCKVRKFPIWSQSWPKGKHV